MEIYFLVVKPSQYLLVLPKKSMTLSISLQDREVMTPWKLVCRNGNDNAPLECNCEGLGSHIFNSYHFHSRIYFSSTLAVWNDHRGSSVFFWLNNYYGEDWICTDPITTQVCFTTEIIGRMSFCFPFSVGVDDKTNFCLHLPFLNDIETRRPIAHLSIGGRGYSSEQVWTAWGEGFPCGRGGFLKWTSLNSSFWVSKWTSLTGLEGVSHVSMGSGSGRVPQVNKFEQVWNRRRLHGELPFSCDQNDRQTGLKTFPSLPGQKNTNDSLSHPTILTSVA